MMSTFKDQNIPEHARIEFHSCYFDPEPGKMFVIVNFTISSQAYMSCVHTSTTICITCINPIFLFSWHNHFLLHSVNQTSIFYCGFKECKNKFLKSGMCLFQFNPRCHSNHKLACFTANVERCDCPLLSSQLNRYAGDASQKSSHRCRLQSHTNHHLWVVKSSFILKVAITRFLRSTVLFLVCLKMQPTERIYCLNLINTCLLNQHRLLNKISQNWNLSMPQISGTMSIHSTTQGESKTFFLKSSSHDVFP